MTSLEKEETPAPNPLSGIIILTGIDGEPVRVNVPQADTYQERSIRPRFDTATRSKIRQYTEQAVKDTKLEVKIDGYFSWLEIEFRKSVVVSSLRKGILKLRFNEVPGTVFKFGDSKTEVLQTPEEIEDALKNGVESLHVNSLHTVIMNRMTDQVKTTIDTEIIKYKLSGKLSFPTISI